MTAPGKDVSSDLGTLLDDDDRDFGAGGGGLLFQADGGRESRRAGADDHHVEVHRLAFRQFGFVRSHRHPRRMC